MVGKYMQIEKHKLRKCLHQYDNTYTANTNNTVKKTCSANSEKDKRSVSRGHCWKMLKKTCKHVVIHKVPEIGLLLAIKKKIPASS